MASFKTRFDIGAPVLANGRTGVVKAMYIGTDKTVACVVEMASVDGAVTTYTTTTLPEGALVDPLEPKPPVVDEPLIG